MVDYGTQLEIDYTFQEAYRSGKYQNVQSYWGTTGPHYCLTDGQTYFAECTEAYFSQSYGNFMYRNDYYPAMQNSLQVRLSITCSALTYLIRHLTMMAID